MSNFERLREDLEDCFEGINRYNPENLVALVGLVNAQVKERCYDLEANLTILKLYQLNPDRYDADTVAKILLLALMNLPASDFVLAKCLIDQSRLNEDKLKPIMDLSDLLETCKFELAWTALSDNPEMIQGISGFEDKIRRFVCHVIQNTYQNISKTLLVSLLGNVTEPILKQICKEKQWTIQPDGFITVSNMEQTVKSRNIAERIDLESIQDILRSAA